MKISDEKYLDGGWRRSKMVDGKRVYTFGGVVYNNIKTRCKVDGAQWKRGPTYIGCECRFNSCDEFIEWARQQKGYNLGWQLDKDLLIKGNKVYSKDTCVFLPREINNCLIRGYNARGDFPIGVGWAEDCHAYRVRCSVGAGVQFHVGLFSTKEAAFQAYKAFKEDYIKSLAEQYKDKLDPRAYEALTGYVVEVGD